MKFNCYLYLFVLLLLLPLIIHAQDVMPTWIYHKEMDPVGVAVEMKLKDYMRNSTLYSLRPFKPTLEEEEVTFSIIISSLVHDDDYPAVASVISVMYTLSIRGDQGSKYSWGDLYNWQLFICGQDNIDLVVQHIRKEADTQVESYFLGLRMGEDIGK